MNRTRQRDVDKAIAALDVAISSLEDVATRIDTKRITMTGVRKELQRILDGPLQKARIHGAFAGE